MGLDLYVKTRGEGLAGKGELGKVCECMLYALEGEWERREKWGGRYIYRERD